MKQKTFLAIVMVFFMGIGAAHAQKLARGIVANVGDTWQTVTLPQSYTNMVVVCTARYTSLTTTRALVRVRNAAGNSFQLRMQHPTTYTTTLPLSGYPVYYMVVEAGQYTQAANGVKMEAVRYLSTQTAFKGTWGLMDTPTYLNTYTAPVVVGQVMTFNDPNWSQFTEYGAATGTPPTPTVLRTGKHVGEDPLTTRANEDIGYIVIEAGSGTIGTAKYVAAVGADAISGIGTAGAPFTYALTGLASAEVAICTQAADGGADGGWVVLIGTNSLRVDGMDLAIAEDQMLDTESAHSAEPVAYIVFEKEVAAVAPAAPTGLAGQSFKGNTVLLNWVDNANNEDGFKIERKTGAGTFAEIVQVPANTTSYTDTPVTAGTTYSYRVRAFNAAGNSAYSNEISVTVVQVLDVRHWQFYQK